jgi:hypothetical protein
MCCASTLEAAMTAATWPASAAWMLLGLALTLALAARLTPRRWWRRPNLRALAVLGGGTLAFGTLLAAMFGTAAGATAAGEPAPAKPAAVLQAVAPAASAPAAGALYRVVDELNLRSDRGVGGRRLAVLPAGTLVTATGAAHGDWWELRANPGGRPLEGWASSLWLRRADEDRRRHP